MPINPQYGMGTYNARLPSVNIRLPQTAGGVATPLAFFPSTQRGDVTESLDTLFLILLQVMGKVREWQATVVAVAVVGSVVVKLKD